MSAGAKTMPAQVGRVEVFKRAAWKHGGARMRLGLGWGWGREGGRSCAASMGTRVTPVSLVSTAAAMLATIAAAPAHARTRPPRAPPPGGALPAATPWLAIPAATPWLAKPAMHASAQSSSARPTVPVTASTWIGCAANTSEESSAMRLPPLRTPHVRAASSATQPHTSACSSALAA